MASHRCVSVVDVGDDSTRGDLEGLDVNRVSEITPSERQLIAAAFRVSFTVMYDGTEIRSHRRGGGPSSSTRYGVTSRLTCATSHGCSNAFEGAAVSGADPEEIALQAAVASLAGALGSPAVVTITTGPAFISDVDDACRLVKARRHAGEAAWLELNNKSND